ncbi:aldolase [candidate division KSB3 bacterium]|uniref:Aldolase n=1 Tax=candidate division KSB3 bacterium TaxID=2044937 RepID=A0A2G6KEB4_9BACT|nr:MAG: aldolase [candidate division KSB3 bacterium]
MNIQEIKNAISNKDQVFGTLSVSMSPHFPAALKNTALDFVFIDTEHIALNRETLSWMCQTYTAMNLAPIVRISSPDPYAACQALDGGAAGVIAPYIETVEQVQALRGAIKLRPLKGKKLQRILDGKDELCGELKKYLSEKNANNLFLVNIESSPAIENLDAMLSVPDLDGTLIGPHDLSCSLGIPEQYEHPRFVEALRKIITRTRQKGLIAGIHFFHGSASLAAAWIRMGINFHIQNADIIYVAEGLKRDIQAIQKELGRNAASHSEQMIV